MAASPFKFTSGIDFGYMTYLR